MRTPVKGEKMPYIHDGQIKFVEFDRETKLHWVDARGVKWRKNGGYRVDAGAWSYARVPDDWTDRMDQTEHDPRWLKVQRDYAAVSTRVKEVEEFRAKAVSALESATRLRTETDCEAVRFFTSPLQVSVGEDAAPLPMDKEEEQS